MFRSISLFSFQKYIGVLNVKGSDTNAAAGYQEREGKQGKYLLLTLVYLLTLSILAIISPVSPQKLAICMGLQKNSQK